MMVLLYVRITCKDTVKLKMCFSWVGTLLIFLKGTLTKVWTLCKIKKMFSVGSLWVLSASNTANMCNYVSMK